MISTTRDRDRRPAFCGIDVGTQGVRAEVMTADGRRVGAGSAAIPPGHRDGVRHEQDAATWWSALVIAVRSAVAQAGSDVQITALALDATSGTVLVQDADGRSRGPALMYDDARAFAEADRAQQQGSELWDALGYRMQTSWALPKVMWLLQQGTLGAGDSIVHQSDHLLGRLIGARVATDTSHALKTGVDLRDARWPTEVFAALDVDAAVLPEVVLPGTVLGVIGTDGAAATGLPSGVTVRAGMTDGCAAQIATGALQPGDWSSALGTTLVIKGSTPELIHDPRGAVYSHRNPDGGWLPGGASSTGAGVFNQAFPSTGPAELDALTRQAAGLGAISGTTYALAGVGERFPFVAPAAHGFITGEAADDPSRFAALCQSIAYVERLSYDVMGVLGADVSGTTSMSGGATRNTWWSQLRTDVLGRPSQVPGSVQAAAGMAILAAAPRGQLAATAGRMVRVDTRFIPDAARGAELRPGYERLLDELVDRGWLDGDLAARALARPVGAR